MTRIRDEIAAILETHGAVWLTTDSGEVFDVQKGWATLEEHGIRFPERGTDEIFLPYDKIESPQKPSPHRER